jgi:hypothetical protein
MYSPLLSASGSSMHLQFALGVRRWELVHGRNLVGYVDPDRGEVGGASGEWLVEGLARRGVAFEPRVPNGLRAAYYPRRLLAGGSITFSPDHWYDLRMNPITGHTRLVDDESSELMSFKAGDKRLFGFSSQTYANMAVHMCATDEPEPVALLATLAACYVLIRFYPAVS